MRIIETRGLHKVYGSSGNEVHAEVAILPAGPSLVVCDRHDAAPTSDRVCWPDDSSYHLAGSLPPGRHAAWFDLGTADPALAPACARAQFWYRQALAELDGLEKVRVDKRLEQISAMNLPPRLSEAGLQGDATLATARFLLTRMKAFEPTDLLSLVNDQTIRTQ